MTRFVYLSDTHIGASGLGYHQQKAYPEKLSQVIAALAEWIEEEGDIDFALHGGDLADLGTEEQILHSVQLFQLPAPVYLCLGNHDVSERNSLAHWLKLAPQFFPGGRPEFVIETDDCAIHVMPNQWGKTSYYWEGDSYPHPDFLPEQMQFFEKCCRATKGKFQILATHSPVFGLPEEQTGLPGVLHEPYGEFQKVVMKMVRSHPDLCCVLGAHNHMNMRIEVQGVNYVTSSALVEMPFEFKLFEIRPDSLCMKTVSLAATLPIETQYDFARSFVQGRTVDREFLHRTGPHSVSH